MQAICSIVRRNSDYFLLALIKHPARSDLGRIYLDSQFKGHDFEKGEAWQ